MRTHFKLRRVSKFTALTLSLMLRASCLHAGDEFTLETARAAAGKGDARAEYFLAIHYAKGDGVPSDYTIAARYMRQAAEQGLAYAQNDLGAYYAKGLGVKQDFVEAAQWYRKAAEQGDALAQFSMGRIYSQGRGVPEDAQESLKWFKKAAEQNQPDALETLGDIYLKGRKDISIDFPLAFKYLQAAVKQGRVASLNSLGLIYENGYGVEKNPEQAAACYREAAEKNDARAQMNLGRMYEEGLGVKKDMVEAYKWFSLASNHGEGIANHFIEEMEDGSRITPVQIQEARRLADEFDSRMEAKSAQKSSAPSTETSAK